jgi:outer membrane protein TolC
LAPPILVVAVLARSSAAHADDRSLSFAEAIARARTAAPDLAVAAGNVRVARRDVDVATVYPNPTLSLGTSTKAARYSSTLSVPLVLFGQRGASRDVAEAELAGANVDGQTTWIEVRAATAHAFVELWHAEQIASARTEIAALTARLEDAVHVRIESGSGAAVELLRAHAERLKADAEAAEAKQLVAASRASLGRWIGVPSGGDLHTAGDPPTPLRRLRSRRFSNRSTPTRKCGAKTPAPAPRSPVRSESACCVAPPSRSISVWMRSIRPCRG